MRRAARIVLSAFALAWPGVTVAATAAPPPSALERTIALTQEVRGTNGAAIEPFDAAIVRTEADGAVAFLSAAVGRGLETPSAATAAERARAFVQQWREAFGLGARSEIVLERSDVATGRSWHRFQQTMDGVPVFGGEMVVQLDPAARVECIQSSIARQSQLADALADPAPAMSAEAAAARARADAAERHPQAELAALAPLMEVFVPELLRMPGEPRLVWVVTMRSPGVGANEQVFVDALDGQVIWRMPLDRDALNRQIQDANGGNARPFTTVRTEGGPVSGIADADNTYDFLGDTWSYYWSRHGRDSFDNAGAALRGVVRYCGFGADGTSCANASFSVTDTMYVGAGWAADDVIGHEVTHGVTSRTSHLIYANQSGAINESMSDVFGEFVDLTNGRGTDTAPVRWLVSEDRAGGALRDMSSPSASPFFDPDRLGSSYYVPPSSNPTIGDDYGGVHTNSGVNNKLCFLLVDGQSFNGQDVRGLGINPVSALYYEAQIHLLTASSGWTQLYFALVQSARNLGWSVDDRNNLYRACAAVEIAYPLNVYADAASTCPEAGAPLCSPGFSGPARTLGVAVGFANPGDTIVIQAGTYHEGGPLTIDKTVRLVTYSGPVLIDR